MLLQFSQFYPNLFKYCLSVNSNCFSINSNVFFDLFNKSFSGSSRAKSNTNPLRNILKKESFYSKWINILLSIFNQRPLCRRELKQYTCVLCLLNSQLSEDKRRGAYSFYVTRNSKIWTILRLYFSHFISFDMENRKKLHSIN